MTYLHHYEKMTIASFIVLVIKVPVLTLKSLFSSLWLCANTPKSQSPHT